MAAKSEASQDAPQDASVYLMDSTLDEYVAVCKAVAGTMGFRSEEHEIARKVLVLKGKMSSKTCTVIATIPSLRVQSPALNSIIRAAGKETAQVILLSPFVESASVVKNKSLKAAKTGNDFISKAIRTSAFRQLRYRVDTGEEGIKSRSARKYHDLMKYARERYDTADYGEALKTVAAVLSLQPLSDEAFRLEGNIHFRKGEYDDAILSFDSAVRINPHNVDNWFGKATTLYMLGRFEEELRCYESILRLKPGHRGALQNMGATLQHLGKLREAIIAYERLLRLKRNDVGVMKNLAIAKYNLGDADGALRTLDAILALDKKEVRALRMKGLIMAEQGKEGALDCLLRYTSMTKDDEVLQVIEALKKSSRAIVQETEMIPAQSEQVMEQQVVAEPELQSVEEEMAPEVEMQEQELETVEAVTADIPEESAEAILAQSEVEAVTAPVAVERTATIVDRMKGAGMLADRAGMLDAIFLLDCLGTEEALDAEQSIWNEMTTGLSVDNAPVELLERMEKAAFSACNFIEAERMGRRLVSVSASPSLRKRFAASLAFLERYGEALTELKAADTKITRYAMASLWLMLFKPGKAARMIRKEGEFPLFPVNNLGVAVLEKSGPAGAVQYFESIEPSGQAALNNLGVCLMLDGDREEGVKLLQLNADRDGWQYLFNLGASLMEERRFEEAAGKLRLSLSARETGTARNSLGVALAELKEYDSARTEFEAALRAEPPYTIARRNLRKLERKR